MGFVFVINCDYADIAKEILAWLFAFMTLIYMLHTISSTHMGGNS